MEDGRHPWTHSFVRLRNAFGPGLTLGVGLRCFAASPTANSSMNQNCCRGSPATSPYHPSHPPLYQIPQACFPRIPSLFPASLLPCKTSPKRATIKTFLPFLSTPLDFRLQTLKPSSAFILAFLHTFNPHCCNHLFRCQGLVSRDRRSFNKSPSEEPLKKKTLNFMVGDTRVARRGFSTMKRVDLSMNRR